MIFMVEEGRDPPVSQPASRQVIAGMSGVDKTKSIVGKTTAILHSNILCEKEMGIEIGCPKTTRKELEQRNPKISGKSKILSS